MNDDEARGRLAARAREVTAAYVMFVPVRYWFVPDRYRCHDSLGAASDSISTIFAGSSAVPCSNGTDPGVKVYDLMCFLTLGQVPSTMQC
jgi:hypothetical protein